MSKLSSGFCLNPKPNNGFVLNPITNRYIAVDSKVYNRLVKAGSIEPVTPQIVTPEPIIQVPETKIENVPKTVPVVTAPPVKELLANELTDIVKEHKKKFAKELTQKQTDALLRKLLYDKLCVSKKKKKVDASSRKPAKKPKKIKFKIATPPPSSDSETESVHSDSDSSSSDES